MRNEFGMDTDGDENLNPLGQGSMNSMAGNGYYNETYSEQTGNQYSSNSSVQGGRYMPGYMTGMQDYNRQRTQESAGYVKSGLVYNDGSSYGQADKAEAQPEKVMIHREKPHEEPKKEEAAEKPRTRKKKRFSFAKLIAAALIFGIVSGSSFYGVNYLLGKGKGENVSSSSKSDNVVAKTMSDTGNTKTTLDYDVAKIVADSSSFIVSITTTSTTTYQYYFQSIERETPGAGSGIIIGKNDKQLFIATNYHVIKGANSINIGFIDDEVVKATVKGYDSEADVAVVAVNFDDMKESTSQAISIAAVGDSDALVVGEPVVAIGNALGYGQSVTVGYISALDRKVEGYEGSYIQTDAAINPGNSGGALINSKGQVVGINSAKYVDSTVEGMGFSIPSTRAMQIIENIISGKNGKTYLGISGADISKEYSQIYGFPTGIYVKNVEGGSPAEAAGLHSGDIIVEFNGEEVYTVEDLSRILSKMNEGDKVKIKAYRADDMGNYEKVEFNAELGFTVTN